MRGTGEESVEYLDWNILDNFENRFIKKFNILKNTPRTPGNRPYVFPSWWKKTTCPQQFFSIHIYGLSLHNL